MWKQLIDLGKQYLGLARKIDQHELDIKDMRQGLNDVRRDIKDLREEVRALTQIIQEIKWEQRHDRELAARDREILILRLENYMFRNERGLPPPGLDDQPL